MCECAFNDISGSFFKERTKTKNKDQRPFWHELSFVRLGFCNSRFSRPTNARGSQKKDQESQEVQDREEMARTGARGMSHEQVIGHTPHWWFASILIADVD